MANEAYTYLSANDAGVPQGKIIETTDVIKKQEYLNSLGMSGPYNISYVSSDPSLGTVSGPTSYVSESSYSKLGTINYSLIGEMTRLTGWSVSGGSASASGNTLTINKNSTGNIILTGQFHVLSIGDHGDHGGIIVKVNNTLYEAVHYNNGSTYHEWGAYETTIGASTDTTAYNGQANTNIAMANSKCFTPKTSTSTTIWTELQNYRTLTGMNTWFIPSVKELETIRTGGADVKGSDTTIATWFKNFSYNIWSSNVYSSSESWWWWQDSQAWSCDYGRANKNRVIFFSAI